MSISSASFKIKTLTTDTYQVRVIFLDETGQKKSKSGALIFKQKQIAEEGTNVDSFTKNASVKTKKGKVLTPATLTNVFGKEKEKQDLKNIKDAQTVLLEPEIQKNITGKNQNIMVVDLNDSQGYYAKSDQIAKGQKIVEEFLKSSDPTKFQATYTALKEDLDIDFIIAEGPIKYNLIRKGNMFSPEQIEFFLSHEGKGYHCQLAEFIMNGFKFGQTAKLKRDSSPEFKPEDSLKFKPEDYIFYIGKDSTPKPFRPLNKSLVLFPPEYKEMYAGEKDAPNVEALSSLFHTTIISDPKSGITTMISSLGK